MKELIKHIRKAGRMSQEQFAAALGTTALSVIRWENGKAIPNRMAQSNIYEFCKNKGIDPTPLILSEPDTSFENGTLTLYHGSKRGISGKIAPISREECDFGKGFYMGTMKLQPLSLICNEESPVLYTVRLETSGLRIINIGMDIDWAMIIAYNRKEMESAKGTPIYEKYATMLSGYDIAVGYIANDRMYTELSRFFNRTLTDTALINCLSALDLGRQYVALTEKACSQIEVIEEKKLSRLETSLIKDISTKRRKEGISLAEEIELKYRREGRFFDEILKGDVL